MKRRNKQIHKRTTAQGFQKKYGWYKWVQYLFLIKFKNDCKAMANFYDSAIAKRLGNKATGCGIIPAMRRHNEADRLTNLYNQHDCGIRSKSSYTKSASIFNEDDLKKTWFPESANNNDSELKKCMDDPRYFYNTYTNVGRERPLSQEEWDARLSQPRRGRGRYSWGVDYGHGINIPEGFKFPSYFDLQAKQLNDISETEHHIVDKYHLKDIVGVLNDHARMWPKKDGKRVWQMNKRTYEFFKKMLHTMYKDHAVIGPTAIFNTPISYDGIEFQEVKHLPDWIIFADSEKFIKIVFTND